MRSFRNIKIAEPPRVLARTPDSDSHSLLREIYALHISHQNSVHPQGKILFAEGELARGIYILRSGRATSSISSHDGRVVILRIALPGDVLGLNSVLRSSSYDTTVKTVALSYRFHFPSGFPEANGPQQAGYLCHIEDIEPSADGTCGSHDILTLA